MSSSRKLLASTAPDQPSGLRASSGLVALLSVVLMSLLLSACKAPTADSSLPAVDLSRTLGASSEQGYAAAQPGTTLVFPDDHRAHPAYRIQWWYYTGQLQAAAEHGGERIGYQLALFRYALRADDGSQQGWASPQIYMAHAALSFPERQHFVFSERLARPAAAVAGAEDQPWQVWVEDHSARALSADSYFPLQVQASDLHFAFDLQLAPGRGPLLHGEQGYSEKSSAPGSASYYVSYTRLPTSGRVRIGDQWIAVTGSSWMDQEWGSAILTEEQSGWDWLSLQLDNGFDLMIFRIRDHQHQSLTVRGSLIDPEGQVHAFVDNGATMLPTQHWTSPHSGSRYNTHWSLDIPEHALALEIRPLMADQELRTRVVYWEGMIEAGGQHQGHSVSGRGYLEMTGAAR